jgi:ERCC4-type nuclease
MQVAVAVDDREPEAVVDALAAHPEVTRIDVERLDAGDIVVGDVAFERKTPEDYVGSALGSRGTDLDAQLERMEATYRHSYLLVESDLSELDGGSRESGPHPAAVRGSVASYAARTATPVLPCSDRERLVDMAVRIGRKHAEEPSTRALPTGSVAGATEPTAKRMYGCIEGIGPTTAMALYEAFPTVSALADASREDLLAVDGIGETRADAVYATLR